MFEPHYVALPAFTVGVLLGAVGRTDQVKEEDMTGIYILGLTTICFIATLNIRDELRSRRAEKHRNRFEK